MEHRDEAQEPPRAPEPPEAARAVFGDRLALAVQYADRLADTGVSHGLIGPREVPRLWERHLLNCAVLSDLLPVGAAVVDVGSGAGLPGIPVAVRRPDLSVTLVEPLLRRVTWLEAVLPELGLSTVQVRRARAEELAHEVSVPFVTARAVAPLDRLVRWGAPLLVPGGEMLAIKGRSAQDELTEHAALLGRWGISGEVVRVGASLLEEPTVVVRLTVPDPAAVQPHAGRAGGSGKRARRRR
ncbi:MAG TPA: 16S rRNA (guanine(527)-N(7))-methyltransferase RsmG [Marmoricola sp.]|nr:16S rRNA (guanine(527)-N(7))-methyltransferase RsmG [Marmoricola sp.]